MGGQEGPRAERFAARLNEADAMFTAVSDAGGVPYAPVGLTVWSRDHDDPNVYTYLRERQARMLPAMRRRIARDRFSIALPRWVEVPGFEPVDNMVFLPPPGDGSKRAILDFVARWATRPFAPDRPPWRTLYFKDVVWDGVPGRVVMVNQRHHAVIDGIGAKRLRERQAPLPDDGTLPELPPPPPYDTSTAFERWKEGWALEGAKAREGLQNTWARARWAAAHPAAGARRAREVIGALRRMQGQQSAVARSPLLRRQSDDIRFDWVRFDVAALKTGAKAAGGTFNDGFMAAMALGLHAYHRDHAAPTSGVRAAMAVNTRADDSNSYTGNEVTAVIVELPLGDDPAEVVKACHEVARSHIEDRDVLWLVDRFRALANRLPRRWIVPITRRTMARYDLQMSSVPGSAENPVVAGVEAIAGFGLSIGPSALTATCISTAGVADLALATDRAAIPDGDHLVACIERGVEAVIALGAP